MYIYLHTSCLLILKTTLPSRYIFPHLSMRKFKFKVVTVRCPTHTHLASKTSQFEEVFVVDVKGMKSILTNKYHLWQEQKWLISPL